MMITVKLRCDYIQELSGGVRDADGCGAGREEEGGREGGLLSRSCLSRKKVTDNLAGALVLKSGMAPHP